MLRRSWRCVPLAVLLHQLAPAFGSALPAQVARYVLSAPASRVWFEAEASMAPFRGTAGTVRGWARFSDREGFSDAAGLLELDVASFRTGNGTRDRHLRETMAADSFPRITWQLLEVRGAPGAEGAGQGMMLVGDLTIRGVTRRVEMSSAVTLAGDTLRVSGALPVRFTEYGMAPPRRVLGMVRVADLLLLRGEVVFVREQGPGRGG